MNLTSNVRNLVSSAFLAGTMAFATPAVASEFELLPDYRVAGEASGKIIGSPRIDGYTELKAEIDLVSYGKLKLDLGVRVMNYFRNTDKTTEVQPDVINYDLWPEISFSSKFGDFSLNYYHQCMHNIDEENPTLANDSRTHNIIRLSYKRDFDVLEGLELFLATGPYVDVHSSKYIYSFEAEAQLSLVKLWDNGALYIRTKENPIIAEKKDGWWEFNMEEEIGMEIKGKSLSLQTFLKYQRLEDYLMFDSGTMNLFFIGIRFR